MSQRNKSPFYKKNNTARDHPPGSDYSPENPKQCYRSIYESFLARGYYNGDIDSSKEVGKKLKPFSKIGL